MQKNIKSLLREIHERDTRELVADHVRVIQLDEGKKEITVLIDKRYAINTLRTTQYIHHFIGGLKKCFWEKYHIILRLDHPHQTHDRETLIPYVVHY